MTLLIGCALRIFGFFTFPLLNDFVSQIKKQMMITLTLQKKRKPFAQSVKDTGELNIIVASSISTTITVLTDLLLSVETGQLGLVVSHVQA